MSVIRIIPIMLVLAACGGPADRTRAVAGAASVSAHADVPDGAGPAWFGVVGVRGDTTCLRASRPIAPGRSIIIALPLSDTIITATTGEAMPSCPDEAPARGDYFAAVKGSLSPGTVGIAILATNAIVVPPQAADVDRDGSPEVFRICASTEGLHLTVWAGKALSGRRIWHHYYYLGYDVEPSCTPADYADDEA